MPHWQIAVRCLMAAAEKRGPVMMARIAVVKALDEGKAVEAPQLPCAVKNRSIRRYEMTRDHKKSSDDQPPPPSREEAIAIMKGGLGKAELALAASFCVPLYWVNRIDVRQIEVKNGSAFFLNAGEVRSA